MSVLWTNLGWMQLRHEALRTLVAVLGTAFAAVSILMQPSFRTRSVLCLAIRSGEGPVFSVAQPLGRCDGKPFAAADQVRFQELTSSLGAILETGWQMQQRWVG